MAEQLSSEEIQQYVMTAITHLVDVAKTGIGLHMEMYEVGLEYDRTIDLSKAEPEDLKEWEQILFSCEVLETAMGFKQKSHEYPEIVEMLQQHFYDQRAI